MANQGLFTAGTSVEELLQQRNKRSTDLQQQLMQQAQAGARDPVRAQAASLIGSTIGRALGGASGGRDKQMEDLRSQEESKVDLRARMAEAVTSKGDYAGKMTLAKDLMDANHVPEAGQIIQLANKVKKDDQDSLAASVAAEDTESDVAAQQEADNALANSLEGKVPEQIIKAIRDGNDEARAYGYKNLGDQHSSLAKKVFEAYGAGYEVGSPANMKKMQEQMNKGSSTNVTVNVDSKGNQELTKAQRSAIQGKLMSTKDQLKTLDKIGSEFNDSYFTYEGAAWSKIGAFFDKLGVSKNNPIVGGTIDYNAGRVTQVAQIDMLFNQYRKEITGAAAAVAELEALKKAYLNADRGPEATKAMISTLKDIGRRGYEELKSQLSDGLDLNSTSIDWNDNSSWTDAQLDAAYEQAMKDAN